MGLRQGTVAHYGFESSFFLGFKRSVPAGVLVCCFYFSFVIGIKGEPHIVIMQQIGYYIALGGCAKQGVLPFDRIILFGAAAAHDLELSLFFIVDQLQAMLMP